MYSRPFKQASSWFVPY